MTVGTRLRGAFALYIALLTVLLWYHARTIRHAVESGRELTTTSTRLRVLSTDQIVRIGQMTSDAQKYVVTRDRGYLRKFLQSADGYEAELRRLDSATLSRGERELLMPVVTQWTVVHSLASTMESSRAAPAVGTESVTGLLGALDDLRTSTRTLASATQDALLQELDDAERTARASERMSWLAAAGALIGSIVLSALLIRSIVEPIQRLTDGTREISAGRFDYRLAARGTDELAQVARDFNSMTERLDELDRVKRDFVSKVSHDLKTPLSSMQETIGVLLDQLPGPLSDKQRQLLELTRESGNRLSGMLGKLLDLSRIESGPEPALEMVDVVPLVHRAVSRVSAASAARGLKLSVTEPARRRLLRGDEAGLEQVIENLLENAIKFSPAGSAIDVDVADLPSRGNAVPPERWAALRRQGLRGGAVLVSVADQGTGIADVDKERVFERFFQADAGRAVRSRGVGLGLSICREIVVAHGGTIWVTDRTGRGSVFRILLPGSTAAPDATSPNALAIGATQS